MANLKIFAGRSNVELAKEICDYFDIEMGRPNFNPFSNGNLSVQILENVREKYGAFNNTLCGTLIC